MKCCEKSGSPAFQVARNCTKKTKPQINLHKSLNDLKNFDSKTGTIEIRAKEVVAKHKKIPSRSVYVLVGMASSIPVYMFSTILHSSNRKW